MNELLNLDPRAFVHLDTDKAERRKQAEHLVAFGYAPGDYMKRCGECKQIEYDSDKYASRCRKCAEAAFANHKEELVKFDFLQVVEAVCKAVGNTKADQKDILASAGEEYGELATEVKIAHGLKNKPPGRDGIVGEAIDLMLCAADMIHSELGSLDNDQVKQMVMNKLNKWKTHYTKA